MDAILNFLPYIFYILLAITILVFIHELGHFLFAKLFGMRVEKFSVGFPPKVFGKKVGETEYVIGATPLGGYVKISGMVDESMDTDALNSTPEPWEYRAKPIWQRAIVITGGVLFNMILAVVIFAGLRATVGEAFIPAENVRGVFVREGSLAYTMGVRTGDRIIAIGDHTAERFDDLLGPALLQADPLTLTLVRGSDTVVVEGPRDIVTQLNRTQGDLGVDIVPALIGGVGAGSAAEQAGLAAGDRIVTIDSQDVAFWSQIGALAQVPDRFPLQVTFYRADSLASDAPDSTLTLAGQDANGRLYTAALTPTLAEGDSLYRFGIAPPQPRMIQAYLGVERKSFSLSEAVVAGFQETGQQTSLIVTSLTRVFSGRDNFRENVGGPIMIAKVTREAARSGWSTFWNIVALLSITLAIMNILPIPALDGGHLMFLVYEAIFRKEPSLKVRMALQQAGMALLLLFMVFVFINDGIRLFG